MSFQPHVCLIIPVGERAFASAPLRDSLALRGSCRCPRIQLPCSALSCLAVVCAVLLNSAVVSSAAPRASLRTPLSPLFNSSMLSSVLPCPAAFDFSPGLFHTSALGLYRSLLFSSPRLLQFHNQLSRVGDLISCERR